jgi:aspartyl-tRNA synthetase
VARFIDELKRTHYCGELREADIDGEVVLFGWVQSRRDHGGCIFIDLRDREGIAQVVFDPSVEKTPFEEGDRARPEWVLGIRGRVRDRGEMRNPNIPTGAVEVVALEAVVFNQSETPPFEIEDDIETNEDKRLQHRYLDLRRPQLQKSMRIRHHLNMASRNFLSEHGFLEIETPFMVKYTPGGARNFLVPARQNPGNFYALAESPQLYKQLLMCAGYDRYFQIVRCFRDEDLRLDRQPEFTQIDVEMSFINEDDLFQIVEGLVFRMWKEALGVDLAEHYPNGFPRMGYEESMRRFGNDKPDLRFGLEHTDLTDHVIEHGGGGIPLLEPIAQKFASGEYRRDLPSEIVKAMVIPASQSMSRTELDKLEQVAKSMGSKGLARAKVADDGSWTQSPFAKNATEAFRKAVNEATGASPGDIILFQFGPEAKVQTVMANLRLHLGKRFGMIPESGSGGEYNFLWVVNPPLFEWDEEGGRWVAAHHMFTRPHDEYVDLLEKDPGKVLCYRYDLVLNGFEIAGGSIRLHDPEVQRRVFGVMGLGEEDVRDKFGFLLDALQYGAPPHGGIAMGMDRVAMLAAERDSIRDVIAFPKTQRGHDPLSGAPGPVSPDQLAELQLRVI